MVSVPASSTHRQAQTHVCPWCGDTTDLPGICHRCNRRIEISQAFDKEDMLQVPAFFLWRRADRIPVLNPLRVLKLMQEAGAISNWIRVDMANYAMQLGVTQPTVYRAIAHMVKWGWLEQRPIHRRGREYRLAISGN